MLKTTWIVNEEGNLEAKYVLTDEKTPLLWLQEEVEQEQYAATRQTGSTSDAGRALTQHLATAMPVVIAAIHKTWLILGYL